LTLCLPTVCDLSRGCDRWNRSEENTLATRSSHVERRRWFFVPPILASFTVAIFIGAVFRYARRTSTALPGEGVERKLLLP